MSGVPFMRKELRERIGWSEPQVRRNLDQLVELGYVGRINGRQGSTFRYLLLDDGAADPEFCFGEGEVSTEETKEPFTKIQRVNGKSSPLRPEFVSTSPTV
jgi:Fe2+ or Zn2+ uptake regulation protein